MFKENDKLNLTLINAKDINGNSIPFTLKLPLINDEYNIPEKIASIDVFEYHEGLVNGGNIAFSIYIGEETTIRKLTHKAKLTNIKVTTNVVIESIDSPICKQQESGKELIYAALNNQDIVISSKEELNIVIKELSDNLNIINKATKKIRTLSKRK